jgi:hypothetical protein
MHHREQQAGAGGAQQAGDGRGVGRRLATNTGRDLEQERRRASDLNWGVELRAGVRQTTWVADGSGTNTSRRRKAAGGGGGLLQAAAARCF